MKKLLLIIAFFIYSCQINNYEDQPLAVIIDGKNSAKSEHKTKDQFISGNLKHIKDKKKKTKIALLLPLSSKHKDLGYAIANSAFISLFENDKKKNIELILFDSKADPKQAKKIFRKIIDQKINIVIGPIFSSIAKEIKEDAIENNITVISFSNNRDLMLNINTNHFILFIIIISSKNICYMLLAYCFIVEKLRI